MLRNILRYELIRIIGKGGMGEVYLAYDLQCSRKVALKRIREDLCDNPLLKQRFLREAKITADLVHPGIISVYSIHSDSDPVYYTMPYIEGYTLKSLLKSVWQSSSLSKELIDKTSIETFLPIFHKICSTVEYVHSRGILHRDLKPDNILLGIFNEVVILDWGAAVIQGTSEDVIDIDQHLLDWKFCTVTVPGKIVGTPDYMAPERFLGDAASEKTDIYALGVIFYQMLTLSFPYRIRKGKRPRFNPILLPNEVSPNRDIPTFLSHIVMKALSVDPVHRYASVKELRIDIEQYLEGTSEWITKTVLSLTDASWKRKQLTPSQWFPLCELPNRPYHVLVSQMNNGAEVRLECRLTRKALQEGFGFFLMPHDEEQSCGCWIQAVGEIVHVRLMNRGLILQQASLQLPDSQVVIVLEKRKYQLSLFLNTLPIVMHIDYLPHRAAGVCLFVSDPEEIIGGGISMEGMIDLQVSCLAIPDAFLFEKMYDKAVLFYRRISESFAGRKEAKEALFYMGIALLEKGSEEGEEEAFSQALLAFEGLHDTTSAPLEYLGKALVYQRLGEYEEEVKSLLLGLKRYVQHFEVVRLKDHGVYRFRESLHKGLPAALLFTLFVLQYAPDSISPHEEKRILQQLQPKVAVSLFCVGDGSLLELRSSKMELLLSYWSGFTPLLPDLFQRYLDLRDYKGLADLFYVAMELGNVSFVRTHITALREYIRSHVFSEDIVEVSPHELLFFLTGLERLMSREDCSKIFADKDVMNPILTLYLFDLFAKNNIFSTQSIDTALSLVEYSIPQEYHCWTSHYGAYSKANCAEEAFLLLLRHFLPWIAPIQAVDLGQYLSNLPEEHLSYLETQRLLYISKLILG